jgi:hypothetical protein
MDFECELDRGILRLEFSDAIFVRERVANCRCQSRRIRAFRSLRTVFPRPGGPTDGCTSLSLSTGGDSHEGDDGNDMAGETR